MAIKMMREKEMVKVRATAEEAAEERILNALIAACRVAVLRANRMSLCKKIQRHVNYFVKIT